jgi:hypoxanthine-DNA glycosylase
MAACPKDRPLVSPCGGLAPCAGTSPRILILGSFPSRLSLAHAEYYGNPKNQFWKIMAAIFPLDPSLPYPERVQQLTACGVALWDVVATCSRQGSADARITEPVFNDIPKFLTDHTGVRLVALNGSRAAGFYRRVDTGIGVRYIVLPSTSPANAGTPFEEKVRRWSVLTQEQ